MTLLTRLLQESPLTLARYMELVLRDPVEGYYAHRLAIGKEGDFITAPEISQIFGELVGGWCINLWERLGSPKTITLVELGPGRGTLMKDILRVARLRPRFLDALTLCLIEISSAFQTLQKETLHHSRIRWETDIRRVLPEALSKGPLLVLANEFFDALPVHQYVYTPQGWRERLIQVHPEPGAKGVALSWVLSPTDPPSLPTSWIQETLKEGVMKEEEDFQKGLKEGKDIFEFSPETHKTFRWILEALSCGGGGALILDYGYTKPAFGDTLQGLHAHQPVSVLHAPGQTDVTTHVNFWALEKVLLDFPDLYYALMTQREFLYNLGGDIRLAQLKARTSQDLNKNLDLSFRRLVDPHQMGHLFKVFWLEKIEGREGI